MDLFGDEQSPEIEENDFPSPAYEPERLKPPSENTELVGHAMEEEHILKLYNSERMPHGLIFSGPQGIGKSTFAFRLARFLLSRQEADPNQNALFGGDDLNDTKPESLALADDHPIVSRVASGGHSDLFVASRKMDERKGTLKASLDVEEIRKIAPFLRKTAAEGDWRVVIVDDADTMNINAQNALLKILEEPPKRTVLILIAHRMGALIPTIRSRCNVMQFQTLSQEHFSELLRLQGHHLGIQETEALYGLSEGRIGHAFSLLDEGGLDVMTKIMGVFEDYPDWKWSQIHILADELARANQVAAYDVFENTMLWASSEVLKVKARGHELPDGPLSNQAFEALKKNSSLEKLLKICDNLQDHFKNVRRSNLEKRQAVLQAFSYFGA